MAAQPSPVVGRDEELEVVRAFAAEIVRPCALLIEGTPGIGKTLLWRETIAAAVGGGARVLVSRPAEAETALAFAGLADLLADYADDVLPELAPPQRRALQVALLLEEDTGAVDRRAVAAATLAAFSTLSRSQALLLAVDDLQWLDRPSAGALEFVLRRLRDEPVATVASVRVGADRAGVAALEAALGADVIRVRPQPLSLADLGRLVRSRSRRPLPPPVVRRLHEASGGNPLYALELAKALGEDAATAELRLPDTLADALGRRVRRVPKRTRDALLEVAAIANPTHSQVDAAALDPAFEAGLLELDGAALRFSHPLLRTAVYFGATPSRRRAVHAQLAERAASDEERALHLSLAAVGPDETTAALVEVGARAAWARAAPVDAAELLERAVALTPPDEQVALFTRQLAAAQAWWEAADLPSARSAGDRAVELAAPGPQRARALIHLAFARQDDFALAVEFGLQAVEEAGDDESLRAEALAIVALGKLAVGDINGAVEAAAEAMALEAATARPALLATLIGVFEAMKTMAYGRPDPEALARGMRLEDSVDGVGVTTSPRSVLGFQLNIEDRYDDARAVFEMLLARAEAHGDDYKAGELHNFLALVECRAGNFRVALEHGRRSVEISDEGQVAQGQGAARYGLSYALAYLGAADEARAAATQGVAYCVEANDLLFRVGNLLVLGFLELSLGNVTAALEHLRPLPGQVAQIGDGDPSLYPVLPEVIEALVAVGGLEEARAHVARLEERGATLQSTWAHVQAARGRALVSAAEGRLPEAIAEFEEALARHERLPSPFERARTLVGYGATLRRAKQKRAAREALAEAAAIFDGLEAPLWAARARAEAERISGRRSTTGLTPTEQRVARLAADGLANKEIAAALFISTKTVEQNLSSAYGKLGIRSRTQLGRVLSGTGARSAEP
jgi:DNA-binding CsgD family transcriptional regulator